VRCAVHATVISLSPTTWFCVGGDPIDGYAVEVIVDTVDEAVEWLRAEDRRNTGGVLSDARRRDPNLNRS
jgi:hypothetical protein